MSLDPLVYSARDTIIGPELLIAELQMATWHALATVVAGTRLDPQLRVWTA
jgi:hypothetical protein